VARGDDDGHAAALEEAAEELYAVAPEDFLTTRTELVARARADGDRPLAAAIGKLRKPSTAAWLVNLLAYEAPDELGSLLDLGAAMRKAQSRLSGAELRRLSQQRHQVVRALATRAHHLAQERGEKVSRSVLDQVGDTLLAALADPEAAEQVRAGHLATPLSYSGFGPAGLAVVPDPVEDDEDDGAVEEDDDERERREHAERERQLEAARTALAQARSGLEAARRKVVRAERTVETSAAERTRAEERRQQAQEALDRAVADAERLTAAAHEAERTLEGQRAAEQAAQDEVRRAEQVVAELDG
jgi:hypothetical protein